jgi:pre-60S factor REI1
MSFCCNTCKVIYQDKQHLSMHYKSEIHRQNLIRKSKSLKPLSHEDFENKIQQSESETEQKQGIESEIIQEVCRDIHLTECFFCGSIFKSKELCFQHMHSHNFRIAYPTKVHSIGSLLEYLSEKIGVGHCCIHCSKQFVSIKAVRNHMIDLHHCMYKFDDEVFEFYNLNDQELIVSSHINELDEMILNNGIVLGHRKYRIYYKQKQVNVEELQKGARIAITGPISRKIINIANDKESQKIVQIREQRVGKKETRLVSKNYHPFTDIHRGNV